jgi:hypothetical protein
MQSSNLVDQLVARSIRQTQVHHGSSRFITILSNRGERLFKAGGDICRKSSLRQHIRN